jgi:hypothetical protein
VVSHVANALGGTTTTTSFSITLPTTQAGDIIILEFGHRATGDGTIGGTYTGPAFQQKHSQLFAASAFSGKTLWSRATGDHAGETVTGSGLTDSCAAIVDTYRGATRHGDPLAGATVVGEENASANETQAQIVTLMHGAMVVLVVVNSPDLAVSSQSSTSPGTLTERAERLSTGGTDFSISHASEVKADLGGTGALTWSQSNAASGSWAYAIVPEAIAAAAWKPQPTFLRRIDTTNRRARFLIQLRVASLPVYPAAAEAAATDAEIDVPFVTRALRSRRIQVAPWSPGMAAAVTPAAPVPVSAWLTPPMRRRRETERRVLVPEALNWEKIAPPPIAWMDPPRAILRVAQRRTLQPQAPQIVSPPPTGPPVPLPAWAAPAAIRRRATDRRALTALEVPEYPQPPAASTDAAFDEPFVTRVLRSRRALPAPSPFPAAVSPPAAAPAEAPVTAWLPPPSTRRRGLRTLLAAPLHAVYPATPAAPDVPFAALLVQRTLRRKKRQGLFLYGGGLVEAAAAPPYPAFATAPPSRIKRTERHALHAPLVPVFPATPAAPAQPVTAWTAQRALRVKHERTQVKAPVQASYPQTAAPAQPVTAWGAPHAFRIKHERTLLRAPAVTPPPGQPEPAWRAVSAKRVEHRRTLRTAARAPFYPATPAPGQPEPAWRAPVAHRIEHARKLRTALHSPRYPGTPAFAPESAWRLRLANRVEHLRKLRRAPHNPAYPGTPAPGQPQPAWRLVLANRVEHVRKHRVAPTQPTFPPTPQVPIGAWITRPLPRVKHERKLQPGAALLSFPITPQPLSAWRAVAAFSVDRTNRRHLIGAPQITFPATPVLTEPLTAWALKTALRRHGWRRLRVVGWPHVLVSSAQVVHMPMTADALFIVPLLDADTLEVLALLDTDTFETVPLLGSVTVDILPQ